MHLNTAQRQGLRLFCLLTLLSSFTYADPKISSIKGKVKNNGTIVLSGSNFGVNNLPILWDTTDNQVYSDELENGDPIPTDQGPWTQNGNLWSNPITISKTGTLRSTHRKSMYSGNTKGYLGWPRISDPTNSDSVYISWWFKPESSISDKGGSNKVIRIWDAQDGNHTRISKTHMHMTAFHESHDPGTSWGEWGGNVNRWNRLDIWVDGKANILKTWTNGELVHSFSNFQKSATTDASLTIGLIGFDPNVGKNYQDTIFHLSDIYASRSMARVELSNSSTWDEVDATKEIQIPTSWSESEIVITLNQGSIDLKEAYLFVIDSNGNVNSEGISICSSCPYPPKGLSVN